MITVLRLGPGVYRVGWRDGDGLLVDSSLAPRQWLDVADMVMHPCPPVGGRVGATVEMRRLGLGSWAVSSLSAPPVAMHLRCECTPCVLALAVRCYRRTLAEEATANP